MHRDSLNQQVQNPNGISPASTAFPRRRLGWDEPPKSSTATRTSFWVSDFTRYPGCLSFLQTGPAAIDAGRHAWWGAGMVEREHL